MLGGTRGEGSMCRRYSGVPCRPVRGRWALRQCHADLAKTLPRGSFPQPQDHAAAVYMPKIRVRSPPSQLLGIVRNPGCIAHMGYTATSEAVGVSWYKPPSPESDERCKPGYPQTERETERQQNSEPPMVSSDSRADPARPGRSACYLSALS